ncbi:uncharacterized protein LOC119977192 isoform X2 [Scyliorhinus canicula]|uniref:uncharacterized protein LOC119977192 isoform X2 n=1 Tax=Scyliorhinus canicula TaxID=7830 RepID=UPI0018F61CEA|nr:uncharacterized protein LOC119977192 isoform X2 [Scyliorhinus canicula]
MGAAILAATIFEIRHVDRRRRPSCDSGRPFCEFDSDGPQLGAITLDQSRPKHLRNSMMWVQVNGNDTPCLFDSGSTESFIHPDTTACQTKCQKPDCCFALYSLKVQKLHTNSGDLC